jgi:hypothetical protein
VERTEAGYTLDAEGRMVALGADVYPSIDIETTPKVWAEEALDTAKNLFGEMDSETRLVPALIVFPQATKKGKTNFLLAWKMELASDKAPRDVVYFIDAVTGGLIESYSNIRDFEIHGTFSGQYYPQHYYDPPAVANYSTTNIKIFDVLGRLITTGNSNSGGFYSLPFGGGFGNYYLQAPLENSWIQPQDNSNHVFTHSFSFVSSSSTLHNYQWPVGDASNVRYHASFIHDYYKNTFSYAAMDYRMIAHLVSDPGTNGSSDGTNVTFGTQGGQYWARSSDVVYHEYTHDTIYHIYGGWIGNGANAQGPAMDEGLADYFACTLNNDPILGEDVGVSRNLDNNTYVWDPSQEAHWNGQVVGGACWDVRQAVGTAIADNLVFRALQVSPKARSFSEFADNVVIADNNYYAGAHRAQISQAFAQHGICTTTAAPSPVAPASGTPGLSVSPTLDWSDAVGATGYDVQVATDSGFASIVRSASVASSSWVVSPALANGTTYYWRARATSACPASAWTTGWSFTTVEVDYVDCGTSCVNLAPGKPVSASGLWDPVNSPGTKLVDYNTGTDPTCQGPQGFCAIASDPGHAQAIGNYFQIDLGAVKSVKSVRVYGRRDTALTQAQNLKLRLSRDGVSWTDFAMPDTTMPEGLLVPTARQARYVKIETTTVVYLSLYEAVVTGPCEVLCSCGNGICDQDEWCDTCPQDCQQTVISLPANQCALCDSSGEMRCGPGTSMWCCPR